MTWLLHCVMLSHLHALWNDLWPNMFAPSLTTLPVVIVTHVRGYRQRERHHEEMKQHVTDTMGGEGGH